MECVALVILFALWGDLLMSCYDTDAHWADIPGQP